MSFARVHDSPYIHAVENHYTYWRIHIMPARRERRVCVHANKARAIDMQSVTWRPWASIYVVLCKNHGSSALPRVTHSRACKADAAAILCYKRR
jgi:hypothetical protein